MSRFRMLVSALGGAALVVTAGWAAPAAAGAVGTADGWGRAVEVPGLGALNAGGYAYVFSVSCRSAGNCAVGGSYIDSANRYQAFVASEQNGKWRQAVEVPGLGTLNAGGNAHVLSVSCGSAGNCVAGGRYTDGAGHLQAFLASENGRWHLAIEVPGSGALNAGGYAQVSSVSCGSAGNCVAGGPYTDRAGHLQAFVASEQNGRWHRAIELPGSGALNAGGSAVVDSVSCGSAGNCVAAGAYTDVFRHFRPFVASEQNGRWHRAIEVPGFGGLNAAGNSQASSVSCASAGNCAVGGDYTDGAGHLQAFVAGEQNGRWRQAIEVPGSGALNAGGNAEVSSVSCGSAGNCAAGGYYTDGFPHLHTFVASEQSGRWHRATEVPGLGGLNAAGNSQVSSVSCSSAGNCTAGGYYQDGSGSTQAFLAGAQDGRWHTAVEVPGSHALNAGGDANISSVSCPPAGKCAAGGSYRDSSGHIEGFVVAQT